MGKKKKGKQKAETDMQDMHDEMLAIESIFGSAFGGQDNGKGFTLRIVPHAGDAEDNHTSVLLEFG